LLLFITILLLNGTVVYAATTAELQAQIAALLQQVQALQTQLQAGSPTQGAIVLNNNLRRGSTDAATNGEVSKLQQFLATDKTIYPEGLVTGYFGSLTEAAMKRWQAKNGIEAVGAVGPITREVIKRVTVAAIPAPASVSTAPTSTPPAPPPPPATPSLGSIIPSPPSGQVTEALTITGSGLTATGNDVYFGSGVIKNLNSFNSGTMITFQIPSEAGTAKILPGTYSIHVSNSNGRSSSSTFVVSSGTSWPSIVSVSPGTAKVGDTITVTGTGFMVSSNDVHLGVGGLRNVTTLAKVKGTLLTFQVPASINGCDFLTGLPPCAGKSYSVVPGSYAFYIVNQNGKTNSVTFTVTQY
jgi:peptidoglycan hydrolase-like protein with peptidoglycan-binding domain